MNIEELEEIFTEKKVWQETQKNYLQPIDYTYYYPYRHVGLTLEEIKYALQNHIFSYFGFQYEGLTILINKLKYSITNFLRSILPITQTFEICIEPFSETQLRIVVMLANAFRTNDSIMINFIIDLPY